MKLFDLRSHLRLKERRTVDRVRIRLRGSERRLRLCDVPLHVFEADLLERSRDVHLRKHGLCHLRLASITAITASGRAQLANTSASTIHMMKVARFEMKLSVIRSRCSFGS